MPRWRWRAPVLRSDDPETASASRNHGRLVTALSRSKGHTFSKPNELTIPLVAGLGDMGKTVKHRHHASKYPAARICGRCISCTKNFSANCARVASMCRLAPGENVIDAWSAQGGAAAAWIRGCHRGYRSAQSCRQIDAFQRGLTTAVLGRNSEGHLIGKAGVMATVINGGDVRAGDVIAVELPAGEQRDWPSPVRGFGL
jgi:hypothetical protein